MENRERYQVVAEVAGNLQAEILRGLLHAHGIPVIVRSGGSTVFSLGVGILGRVQVLVPVENWDAANQLIDSAYGTTSSNNDEIDETDETDEEFPEP